jgi:hypothetical protein
MPRDLWELHSLWPCRRGPVGQGDETVNSPRKPTDFAVRYKLKDEDYVGLVSGNAHFHRSIIERNPPPRVMLLKMAKWGQKVLVHARRLQIVDEIAMMHIALWAIISGFAVRR